MTMITKRCTVSESVTYANQTSCLFLFSFLWATVLSNMKLGQFVDFTGDIVKREFWIVLYMSLTLKDFHYILHDTFRSK